MYKINLFEKFGELLIWGHDMGEEYREKILSEWKNSKQDILNIDFNGISIIDYSASSDIICSPISRLAGELEGKHIVISNAIKDVKENIIVTLERQELCCINMFEEKKYEIIGKCSEGLKNIVQLLYENKSMDSRMLAERLNTTVQVINNRTTTLYKLGMIRRISIDAPTGGKQYIYESII